MSKTTEALKLAAKALSGDYAVHPDEALAAIREALAEPEITTPDVCGEVCARAKLCYGCGKALDEANAKLAEHSGDANEMVYSKPSVFDGVCCGCSKKAADGYALYCVECWEKSNGDPFAASGKLITEQDHIANAGKMVAETAIPEWVDVDDYEEPMKQEPVYAFRRRGLNDFCTCTKERYDELVDKPNLFEVTTFYAEPVGAEQFLKAIAALREGIATCRAEALEEAAKVCDKAAKHYITNNKEQEQVWLLAATSDCAAAIRGMK